MASTVVTLTLAPNEEQAAAETLEQLEAKRGGAAVRGGILYTTVHHDTELLQSALRKKIPGVPFLGTTSCLGVGASPARFGSGRALTGFWLVGDGFRFGVAGAPKGENDPIAVGSALAADALAQGAFGPAEARFAVFHPTPGDEEALLAGVYRVLDKQTPILGGSAADDDVSGKWSCFTHQRVMRKGVVLALCDWPWRLAINYQSGYLAESKRGQVTRSEGRVVYEIDHRPAAEVYNEWLGGKLSSFLVTGGNVLAETTLSPLGVPHSLGVVEAYVLVHPERVIVPGRALSLFADIPAGQEVALMTSRPEALVQRGANVARAALMRSKLRPEQVVGALMVYCAGCVLAIRKKMPEMIREFQSVLGTAPFASVFTLGEQGCVLPGHVNHGNLMASVLLLSSI